MEARTCGSCCLQLKELLKSYEEELGLKGKEFDGTKSKYPEGSFAAIFLFKFCAGFAGSVVVLLKRINTGCEMISRLQRDSNP